jgi:hypothetical protein
VRVGFRFDPQPCEIVTSARYVLSSITNYGHIGRFAVFFAMSVAQAGHGLRPTARGFAFAAIAGVTMGVLVELAEGVTGRGNCRLRDLIPDSAGMALGALAVTAWDYRPRSSEK